MSQLVRCSGCSALLRLPQLKPGQRFRCPRCGHEAEQAEAVVEAAPVDEPPAIEASPYTPPAAAASPGYPGTAYRLPPQGTTILLLGIFGLLCCGILAPIAWVMGHQQLREIDLGVRDPRDRSTTQAGMILGIIGTVLWILGIFLQAVAALL